MVTKQLSSFNRLWKDSLLASLFWLSDGVPITKNKFLHEGGYLLILVWILKTERASLVLEKPTFVGGLSVLTRFLQTECEGKSPSKLLGVEVIIDGTADKHAGTQ